MQLGSDVQIPDGLLAENTLLSEKPRLGFERTETAVHRGSIRLNYLNGNRVSSTVCWNVRQVSLMAQQQLSANSSTSTTGTAAQDHYVSIGYWPTGAGGFGHIDVQVDSDDTQGYSTKDPSVHWWQRLFGAPAGGTEDDIKQHTTNGETATHFYHHISITADQATAMQGAMAAGNGGHYNLIFNNCAQFVEACFMPEGFGHRTPRYLAQLSWLGYCRWSTENNK